MEPLTDQLVKDLLVPGERLLWSGKPAGSIRFEWGDVFLTLFALIWTGISVAAVFSDVPHLISLAFVGVGVYLLVLRYPVDARKRSRTVYGLTDRRALLIGDQYALDHVRTIPLDSLENVNLKVHGDGRGSITGRSGVRDWPHRDEDGDPVAGPLFRYITSPQGVHALLNEARAEMVSANARGMRAASMNATASGTILASKARR